MRIVFTIQSYGYVRWGGDDNDDGGGGGGEQIKGVGTSKREGGNEQRKRTGAAVS